MLILARKVGQGVTIGPDVEITVLEVRGDIVRLGIQAPRTVSVYRKEVCQLVAEANRDAAAAEVDIVKQAAKLYPSSREQGQKSVEVHLDAERSAV